MMSPCYGNSINERLWLQVHSCFQVCGRKEHLLSKDCYERKHAVQELRERWLHDFLSVSTGSQLNSLECLDLSNNNLSVVPKGLPRNLVLLHLEKNSIRSIPGDALTSIRNLEYLLLHNNKLRSRSIHTAAFQVHVFVFLFLLLLLLLSCEKTLTFHFTLLLHFTLLHYLMCKIEDVIFSTATSIWQL